ncbi:1-acyl-sn-glycerol-3-phosphate acyltransferase [Novosphingobium sp. FSY-8]|uniref:1-acyl-sn-glycerol-3-phosphate acyltransferase n=1 Tax=Novosphingobium ovatum TaxID=1908523 RepID=A0ABW9XE02_9SPHN|nr:lysophospholipid acyltransferase family protein [Novosphingobium ovatum]NBC36754.1 1-acyl-sn-glycerol-3-phosphate acyltransferase [Novosphingobium ovatum]
MSWLRQARAWAGIAGFLAVSGPWLLLPNGGRLWRGVARLCWRALLGGFGIRVRVHGTPVDHAGTLFVANHISWTDIPVLGLVLNAGFVAKGDIRGWPLIGRLTAAYGCLFVERERRGKAGDQAAALASHLEGDRALVLFAEGTTGLGNDVLPFRSSLFAMVPGVADGSARVQPVTIHYARTDGGLLSPEMQRQVAWIGDDGLLSHVRGLARLGGMRAEVWFEEPVTATDRKALAKACEAAVLARLQVLRGGVGG